MSAILAPVGGYLAGDQQALAAALRPGPACLLCRMPSISAGLRCSCTSRVEPDSDGLHLILVMKPQNPL